MASKQKDPASQSLDQFLAITQNAPFPMVSVEGPGHTVFYANPVFCHLMTSTLAKLKGRHFPDLLPNKKDATLLLNRVLRTGKPESYIENNARKPPTVIGSYSVWPIKRGTHVVGLVIQVTETAKDHLTAVALNEVLMVGSLRQHELTEIAEDLNAQLRIEVTEKEKISTDLKSTALLLSLKAEELAEKAQLLDLSHDAILVRDIKGRIRYWNHGAEELYGWPRSEAMGKVSHVLLKTKFPTPLKELIKTLYETDRWMGELKHTKRDGGLITVLVRKTLVRDDDGIPTAILENITDITDRKQAEDAKRRLEIMAASNQKLENEIVLRKEVEGALKQSESELNQSLVQARHMQTQLRGLSHQILQVQEEERKFISRELHDEIAQVLLGINLQLSALLQGKSANPEELHKRIISTQRLVEKSVALVHDFARELRPAVLDDLGLVPALIAHLKNFSSRSGIRTHLATFKGLDQLDIERTTALFRVVQECLTNVARHAKATTADVTIRKLSNAIQLEIKDNGKSFQVDQLIKTKAKTRLGLVGMRERVEMVGGTFLIESAPGQGTTVRVTVPSTVALK